MRNRVVRSPVRCSTNRSPCPGHGHPAQHRLADPRHLAHVRQDVVAQGRRSPGNRFGPCSGTPAGGRGMVGEQIGAEVQALLQVGGAGGRFAAARTSARPRRRGAWPPAPSRPRAGRRTPGRGRRAAPAGRVDAVAHDREEPDLAAEHVDRPGRPPAQRLRRRSSTSATSITGTTASRSRLSATPTASPTQEEKATTRRGCRRRRSSSRRRGRHVGVSAPEAVDTRSIRGPHRPGEELDLPPGSGRPGT